MIDVNFLNNQPKEFIKETNILKYLFNVLNEINQELLYIKNNSECEYKNFDTPTKNLIITLKNYNNEMNIILNDDYSKIPKTFKNIINIYIKADNNDEEPLKPQFKIGKIKNKNFFI